MYTVAVARLTSRNVPPLSPQTGRSDDEAQTFNTAAEVHRANTERRYLTNPRPAGASRPQTGARASRDVVYVLCLAASVTQV